MVLYLSVAKTFGAKAFVFVGVLVQSIWAPSFFGVGAVYVQGDGAHPGNHPPPSRESHPDLAVPYPSPPSDGPVRIASGHRGHADFDFMKNFETYALMWTAKEVNPDYPNNSCASKTRQSPIDLPFMTDDPQSLDDSFPANVVGKRWMRRSGPYRRGQVLSAGRTRTIYSVRAVLQAMCPCTYNHPTNR